MRIGRITKRFAAALMAAMILLCTVTVCVPEVSAADDKINIVLDPGHGGTEVGTAARGVGEKVFTYSLALKIKAILDADGHFNTTLTRNGDYTVSLLERGLCAGESGADLLISIHFNGDVNTSKHGVGTWISVIDKVSMPDLASSIVSKITSATGLTSDGVNRRYDNSGYYWSAEKQWDIQEKTSDGLSDYYGILTWGAKFGVPSIIVEHGYMSNSSDCSLIFADGTLDKMAEAEAAAIIQYYTGHTHTYASRTVDFSSFCLINGRSSEKCTVCGHKRNVTTLAAAPDNHFPEYDGDVAATCTTDGQSGWTCRYASNLMIKGYDCQLHGEYEVTPATGHNYVVTNSRAATHTVDGFTDYKCSKCGHTYTQYTAAEGHSYSLTQRVEPSCVDDGYVDYTCSVCGDVYRETMSALGHLKSSLVSSADPSCTEEGYNQYSCSRCSSLWTEAVPALGHDMQITSVAVLCTQEGERHSACTRCGIETVETLPAAGHNISVTEEILPTCTETGHRSGYCLVCGEEIEEDIDALGHDWSLTSETDATCTENGTAVYECTVCGETKTEVTEEASHKYILVNEVAADCENEGYRLYKCSVCDSEMKEEIQPLGHDWGEAVQTARAGFFISGRTEAVCTRNAEHIDMERVPSFAASHTVAAVFICIGAVLAVAVAVAAVIFLLKRRSDTAEAEHDETADDSKDDKTDEVNDSVADAESETETDEAADDPNTDADAEAESAEKVEKV